MPGNLNAIWEAVKGNAGSAWRLASSGGGWTGARQIFRDATLGGKTSKATRQYLGMAGRGISGAIVGAGVGAAWGAISDRESIVGGAMRGAFVGGAAAVSLGHFRRNIRSNKIFGSRLSPLNNISQARLSNVLGMKMNLGNAWKFMSVKKRQGMRNWVVGMGLLGAAQGMMSGEDNPVGGAVGGALAGGIQGAAIYGEYRGIKRWRGK